MSRLAKLQEMLKTEPNDPFLNYAFALETAKEDPNAGAHLLATMNDQFPEHVPAFFRHGQLLSEGGDANGARRVLLKGIEVALRLGDDHAAAEMRELIESL